LAAKELIVEPWTILGWMVVVFYSVTFVSLPFFLWWLHKQRLQAMAKMEERRRATADAWERSRVRTGFPRTKDLRNPPAAHRNPDDVAAEEAYYQAAQNRREPPPRPKR